MALWMSWTLDGVGSAGQTVDDFAAVLKAFDGSLERSRRAFTSDALAWERLKNSAAQVRARLLHEGWDVLERGEPWSLAWGGVQIQIMPRD
ncbi:hypothetical protein ACPCA8_23315 [Streptomyces capoamus]|uniref:hypothetical protein n=1 Tax=Streptomyces capoamus TaxID=68183 RepID=UPI003C2BC853